MCWSMPSVGSVLRILGLDEKFIHIIFPRKIMWILFFVANGTPQSSVWFSFLIFFSWEFNGAVHNWNLTGHSVSF